MLPRIIAICGAKRSGKDTVADVLCKHHGYTKIKISEGLKDMLKLLFGFSDEQLETDAKDAVDTHWQVSPRQLMQFFGTEIMQYELQKIIPNVGRSFWVDRIIRQYVLCNPDKKYVISDLRFQHEYDALLPYNPYVIRVQKEIDAPQLDVVKQLHVSEQEYLGIPCDKVYINNGSLEDVELHFKDIINQT